MPPTLAELTCIDNGNDITIRGWVIVDGVRHDVDYDAPRYMLDVVVNGARNAGALS